jgi:anti-sigma regulatory factor (Ser/Thr protein kinase)
VPSASWTIPAVADQVGFVRQSVAEFALGHGVGKPVADGVRLAVSEALTNVIMHAYRHDADLGTATVSVTVSPTRGILEITVSDDGIGLQPRADSPGIGLGLPLIRQLTDQFDHRRSAAGGTELWMCFSYAT